MLADALKGIRVLDFTHVGAGPACTMLLADMGAEVIKIESLSGDLARGLGPPWKDGESAWFMSLNRNKQSIALDLKHPDGKAIAGKLLETADVLVESYRPGVADRLGFGYAEVSATRPELVYCSISAYGQDSPWKDRPGVDGILQAISGIMSTLGQPGDEPSKMPIPVVDMTTGYLASNAILASLVARPSRKRGERLDISMFNCAIMLQQTAFSAWAMSGKLPEKSGSAAPYAAPNEAYPTSDGWIMLAAYQPSRWSALCAALNAAYLEKDSRFADLPSRVQNRAQLKLCISDLMNERTSEQWVDHFTAAGIMCAEVLNYAQVSGSSPFTHGELNQSVLHSRIGEVTMPRFGLEPSKAALRHAPPHLGEHTREILHDLGFAAEEIERLVGQNAVRL